MTENDNVKSDTVPIAKSRSLHFHRLSLLVKPKGKKSYKAIIILMAMMGADE